MPRDAPSPHGSDEVPTVPRGRHRRRLKVWVTRLCVLLVLNTLLGAVYAHAVTPPVRADDIRALNPAELPLRDDGSARSAFDPRINSQAMRPYPWRTEFFREYTRLRYSYEPYLTLRMRDIATRYVNLRNSIRRSWNPPASPAGSVPTVWFLGGSTMFGEDQRDLFTIPSMVSRRAAADGHPIRVVNLGVPSYLTFQEALLFEQELAILPKPDLVVFYDGVNELAVQAQFPSTQPVVFPAELNLNKPTSPIYARWADSSLGTLLWRRYAPSWASPAGAAGRPRTAAETGRAAIEFYRRGLDLARGVAADHDIPMLAFWQPAGVFHGNAAADWAVAHLPSGVIDISHTLDGPVRETIYTDNVHTNERGARIVADRLWTDIAPRVS